MSTRIYFPSLGLRPFIRSFIISENEDASTYKILPDVSVVMGFQYKGNLSYQKDEGLCSLSLAGATGLTDRPRVFSNSTNIGTLLVVFSEIGAAAFFKSPLHEIFSLSLPLDDLIGRSKMEIVVEQLSEVSTDLERLEVIEKFLLSLLRHQIKDIVVEAAVQVIKHNDGNVMIGSLARQLFVSQSRLEKRFRQVVGASPKKFSSIVRLRRILDLPKGPRNFTQLGLDNGYYDQAHFIKEFRAMTGETPEKFFKK